MKRLILVCILLLGGCVASQKIVIPDEPELKVSNYIPFEDVVCFDEDNAKILIDNMMKIRKDNEKLRQAIKDHNEGK